MSDFYHWTCVHSAAKIERMEVPMILTLTAQGVRVLPAAKPMWVISWFTDLDAAPRLGLGLTSRNLRCNRTAVRFRVIPEDVPLLTRWAAYRRSHPQPLWRSLEEAEGALPAHWWVATKPVRVVRA